MNRPNPKDYATYGEYDVAMNKYCDELESNFNALEKRCGALEKALDKLIKWYDDTGRCPFSYCDAAEGEKCTACLKRHAVRQAIEEEEDAKLD